jgi:hypothetical protein
VVPIADGLPRLAEFQELTSADFANPENFGLQGLILFTSQSLYPFPGLAVGLPYDDQGVLIQSPPTQLWAISPDGLRLGRLTQAALGGALFIDPQGNAAPLLVQYGQYFSHPDLATIDLPAECYGILPGSEALLSDSLPCSDFTFSQDGRLLAFYFGPQICGRGIMLLDTLNEQVVFRSAAGSGHWFELLPEGRALIATGHCEGGEVSLFDRQAGSLQRLGNEPFELLWNADRSALAAQVYPYQGLDSALWGYNTRTNTLFLPQPNQWPRADHPLWTPDGTHLLYQLRSLTYDAGSSQVIFDQPRQLKLVNAASGVAQNLVSDPEYDFHLCAGSDSSCDRWLGDWVQVRRTPFVPQVIAWEAGAPDTAQLTCLLEGLECPTEPERFALNWRTGELLPWDEFTPPSATPQPTPVESAEQPEAGPDFTRLPVYADPDGQFTFYVGLDKHSLWLVPAQGDPALWVIDSSDFIYLP